ncbi:MAG: hypothetical protein ACYCZF_11725 [Anaerolineae bacterium]
MDTTLKVPLPKPFIALAIGQFVAVIILPPSVFISISPFIWGVLLVIFGLLGWNLLRRKAWARVASIFVQGFSIIVHLLVIVPNAKIGITPASPWDFVMLGTTAVSVALSALILYYIDLPDVQVLLQ